MGSDVSFTQFSPPYAREQNNFSIITMVAGEGVAQFAQIDD